MHNLCLNSLVSTNKSVFLILIYQFPSCGFSFSIGLQRDITQFWWKMPPIKWTWKLFKQAVKMSIANWFSWCQRRKRWKRRKRRRRRWKKIIRWRNGKRRTPTVNRNYWHKEWKRNEKQRRRTEMKLIWIFFYNSIINRSI